MSVLLRLRTLCLFYPPTRASGLQKQEAHGGLEPGRPRPALPLRRTSMRPIREWAGVCAFAAEDFSLRIGIGSESHDPVEK